MSAILDAALEMRALGWQPVAAEPGGKRPRGSWKRWKTERVPELEVRAMFSRPASIFLVTGPVSELVVLDCDDTVAIGHWRSVLGAAFDMTTCALTARGRHLYFRLPEGARVGNQNSNGSDGTGKWDIRAEGGGVIAPPSVHESGHVYRWEDGRGPEALLDAPAALLRGPREASSGPDVGLNGPAGASGGAGLTELLRDPPAEGGRNDWLARVAGHYARLLPKYGDYEHHVRAAAASLDPPLPDAEVAKLLPSIWTSEQGKRDGSAFEIEVEKAVERLRIREEARRRLRAVEFVAPESTLTLAEELALPEEAVRWIVEGLAPVDGNILLNAQYKTGKTRLALTLARSLADGVPFLGQPTKLDGRVAIWNREMSDPMYRRWIREMEFAKPGRAALANLRGRPNPFLTPEGVEWTVRWLREREVEFWILDTYAAHFTGDNEQDNGQARAFVTLMDEIKQRAGVSGLILLTHSGRVKHEEGDERTRGATTLDDWADARWMLTRKNETRYIRAHGRDVDFPETDLVFDPRSHRYDVGVGVNRSQSKDHNAERALLEVAGAKPGVSSLELLREARATGGGSTGSYEAAKRRLVDSGRLVVCPGDYGRKGHYLPGHPDVSQTALEVD